MLASWKSNPKAVFACDEGRVRSQHRNKESSPLRFAWRMAPSTIVLVELPESPDLAALIELARREDLGSGDVSTQLVADRTRAASFRLVAKESLVLGGQKVVPAVLAAYDPTIELSWGEGVEDGVRLSATPRTLAVVRGPLCSVLAAERVLLNFLQRLSGVATLTRRFVEAVSGTGAAIYDTRKTTPGWRLLEKYAVRCGGGRNHRMGLYDAVLLKDNHLAGVETRQLAGRVFDMLNAIDFAAGGHGFVAVEAQSVEQAAELMKVVGLDVIILDNFAAEDLRQVVLMRDDLGLRGRVSLEASGGVRLSNVRAIAETGVERISVGAITHSAVGVDMSLERD